MHRFLILSLSAVVLVSCERTPGLHCVSCDEPQSDLSACVLTDGWTAPTECQGETLDFGSVNFAGVRSIDVALWNSGQSESELSLLGAGITNNVGRAGSFGISSFRWQQSSLVDVSLATAQELLATSTDFVVVRVTFHADVSGYVPSEFLQLAYATIDGEQPHKFLPMQGVVIGCEEGKGDANGDRVDGCECTILGPEFCDTLDNDCSGIADDNVFASPIACTTGLLGECAAGTVECQSGNLICSVNTPATDETCDQKDNDCDGTIDEEGSWQSYNEGLGGGAISGVYHDPRTTGRAYATSGNLFYSSDDGGSQWQQIGTSSGGFGALAFPLGDPMQILAASSGLLESFDEGRTWAVRSLGGMPLTSLLVHPGNPDRIYVGTSGGGGVLRSSNAGLSFVNVSQGIPYAYITAMAAPSNDVDDVLATAILLTPQGSFSTSGVVLRTTDGGQSWQTSLAGLYWAYDVKTCAATPSLVFATGWDAGLWRSDDAGVNWTQVTGLTGKVHRIVMDNADCSNMYAVVYPVGVFRSVDGGLNWTGPHATGINLQPGITSPDMISLQNSSTQDLLAATHGGLYKTADGGDNWSSSEGLNNLAMTRLLSDSTNEGKLYLASWGGGLWQRLSPGDAWERIRSSDIPRDWTFVLKVNPADPTQVLVGTYSDIWQSQDAGVSYTVSNVDRNPMDFAFDPFDPTVAYAATQVNGVYKSMDSGVSWTAANGTLTPWPAPGSGNFVDVRRVVTDPLVADRLWIGTNGRGIYRSDDAAASWNPAGTELVNDIVRCLHYDTGRARLYACVDGKGLWASADFGDSWQLVELGLSTSSVMNILNDSENGDLYIATDLGVYRSADEIDWAGVDVACLPSGGTPHLAQIRVGAQRYLVTGASGSGVFIFAQ